MTWDALQREMLAALGHTLYVSVDATAVRVDDEPVNVRADGRIPQESNASRPRNTERGVRPRSATSPDALLRALLRAANLGEQDASTLQSRLPPLDVLTGNAAAKRASWPTLRAQRRT